MTTRTKMLSDGLIIWLEAQKEPDPVLYNLMSSTLAHIQAQDDAIITLKSDGRHLQHCMVELQEKLKGQYRFVEKLIENNDNAMLLNDGLTQDKVRFQKQLKKAEKKLLLAQGVIADLKKKTPERGEQIRAFQAIIARVDKRFSNTALLSYGPAAYGSEDHVG